MDAVFAYGLRPTRTGIGSNAWALSSYRGECIVMARNEAEARRFADGAFLLAMMPEASRSGCASPWQQPALVEAARVATPPDLAAAEAGRIWLPATAPTMDAARR